MSQIINPGTASGGGFDENGTYPNVTVGNATHASSADSATNANYATSAGSATNAEHATTADSATKATQDGDGNDISSTYATRSMTEGTDNLTITWDAPYEFICVSCARSMDDNEINTQNRLGHWLRNQRHWTQQSMVQCSGVIEGNLVLGMYIDRDVGVPGDIHVMLANPTSFTLSDMNIDNKLGSATFMLRNNS